MKVRVRGGYEVRVGTITRKSLEVFDISEKDYQERHWVFDVVPEETKEDSAPGQVVAAAVAKEDAMDTSMAAPILRRGTAIKRAGRK